MPSLNLGRVGFVNKGTYSAVFNYKVNDVVSYGSGIFAALQPSIGQTPTIGGNAYWQEWVQNAIPSQIGNNGKFLSTDGSNLVWTDMASSIHAATSKTTPVDADELALADSAATYGLKKLTWANLKATIISSFGAMIATLTAKTTPVGADFFVIGDSASSNASKQLTLSNLITYLSTALSTSISGVLTTSNLIHVQDQKTSGTAGGSSSAGTNTRILNTVVTNTISGASLVSNQIILPAGTYWVDASCPCSNAGQSKAYLYNATDSNVQIVSTSEYIGNTLSAQHRVFLSGKFTIASQKTFDLRHYITSAQASNGLGVATNMGQIEIYSEIKIWKVA